MTVTNRRTRLDRPGPALGRSFEIAGVPCSVTAGPDILERIDATFSAYRSGPVSGPDVLAIVVETRGETFLLTDSDGFSAQYADEREALVGAFGRLTHGVGTRLARRGVFAIHAAALVHRGGTLLIAGRSGAGKTTLALELVRRGLGLLSDENAISAPDARTILPYRRSLHVRPGTPDLIPELGAIEQPPAGPLSTREWPLPHAELEHIFPGCLAEPAPLRHVVLLGPRTERVAALLEPIPGALAAVELVAATPAAVEYFDAVLQRTARLVEGARCARLHPGTLASSRDLLLEWLDG